MLSKTNFYKALYANKLNKFTSEVTPRLLRGPRYLRDNSKVAPRWLRGDSEVTPRSWHGA
jgi:hypothetical protein